MHCIVIVPSCSYVCLCFYEWYYMDAVPPNSLVKLSHLTCLMVPWSFCLVNFVVIHKLGLIPKCLFSWLPCSCLSKYIFLEICLLIDLLCCYFVSYRRKLQRSNLLASRGTRLWSPTATIQNLRTSRSGWVRLSNFISI